jgi:hypothetical protein
MELIHTAILINIFWTRLIYPSSTLHTGEDLDPKAFIELVTTAPHISFSIWMMKERDNSRRRDTNWKLIGKDLAGIMLILLMSMMKVLAHCRYVKLIPSS